MIGEVIIPFTDYSSRPFELLNENNTIINGIIYLSIKIPSIFNKNCNNINDLLDKICINLSKNKINNKQVLEKQFV